MSAKNGGRGVPPVPPEGHGPPAEPQGPQVMPIQIIRRPIHTSAEKLEDGIVVNCIVMEGMAPVEHTFVIGAPGLDSIKEAILGGIVIPD